MQLDDLYGLPLERFVPERAALAKALRAERRRDEAAEVAKLRKPSASAWAVNQLVRTQPDLAAELFAAGDALRAAQEDLLAGRGDGRALREAGAREREAVDALVDRARGLLSADGLELSSTTLERVSDTLHAAALDDDAREAVAGGRLEHELRHVGLGLGEGAAVFAPAPAPAKRAKEAPAPSPAEGAKRAPAPSPAKGEAAAKPDAAAERRAAKQRAAAQAAEKAEREAARKQARTAVAQAAKREERAGHAVRAVQDRRDRAAGALEEAEAALEAARAKAAEAEEEHRRARAALDES